MNKSYLTVSLILSIVLMSACSNTSSLAKTKANTMQTMPTKVVSDSMMSDKPVAEPAITTTVDWQKIEAVADQKYQEEPLADYYLNILSEEERNAAPWFYAQEFDVTITEAQHRLLLQGISMPLIQAVAEYLGETVAAIYYDNNNSNEFSIKITTLTSVKAIPSKFVYHFKQDEFNRFSIPIYIQASSDKSQQQIIALQEKAWPEILKRYPDTQTIGFSPMTNTTNVMIYRKIADEAERQRIEAELTELVGHPVVVEFLKNRITTL